MKRITYVSSQLAFSFALGIFLLGSSVFSLRANAQTSAAPAPTAGQAQDQPLGDIARKVGHKDTDPAKPKPKVFDNDNLPMQDKISVVGQPADTTDVASNAGTPSAASNPAKPAEDDQTKKQAEWKSWQGKITSQKEQIDLASRELDVLQREYQLRAAEMYADAGNRLRNSAQWDKQDADYKQKLADKQKAIDDAKEKLNDLQEQGRKAGVPSSMLD
jgi:hypothetical protein